MVWGKRYFLLPAFNLLTVSDSLTLVILLPEKLSADLVFPNTGNACKCTHPHTFLMLWFSCWAQKKSLCSAPIPSPYHTHTQCLKFYTVLQRWIHFLHECIGAWRSIIRKINTWNNWSLAAVEMVPQIYPTSLCLAAGNMRSAFLNRPECAHWKDLLFGVCQGEVTRCLWCCTAASFGSKLFTSRTLLGDDQALPVAPCTLRHVGAWPGPLCFQSQGHPCASACLNDKRVHCITSTLLTGNVKLKMGRAAI